MKYLIALLLVCGACYAKLLETKDSYNNKQTILEFNNNVNSKLVIENDTNLIKKAFVWFKNDEGKEVVKLDCNITTLNTKELICKYSKIK